jgi:hypothetical protein
LDRRAGNEILMRFISGVNTHTTLLDDNNQGVGYGLALGFEYHLSRTSQALKRFTLELGAEFSLSYYDIGGLNGKFEGGNFFGAVNYYIFNRPDQIRRYLWYAGIGFRRGNDTVSSPFLTKNYKYQLFSLPVMQAGFKYRFQAGDEREDGIDIGLGVNFLVQSELLRYSVLNEVEDDIDGLFTVNNIRAIGGLSIYF